MVEIVKNESIISRVIGDRDPLGGYKNNSMMGKTTHISYEK